MKLKQLIDMGSTTFQNVVFDHLQQLKFTDAQTLFILHAIREIQQGHTMPNFSKIAVRMNRKDSEIHQIVNELYRNQWITVNSVEDEFGQKKDVLDFSKIYEAIDQMIDEKTDQTVSLVTLKDSFEESFARMLSPFELELIQEWVEKDGIALEVVQLALKEAVLNGVKNMNYIERILFNWNQNGLTTREDVIRHQKEWKIKKRQMEARREFGGE